MHPTGCAAFQFSLQKSAVGLPLPDHFPAVGIKGVVDDPFRGIEGVIVLVPEMAKSLGDCFEAGPFGLMGEGIVGVRAVDDLPSSTSAESFASPYFFRIASNEHS